jgi:large subunit ribosomal protein L25
MAVEVVLKAEKRDVIGKQVKALRRQGRLPAVLYGRKFQAIPVTLDLREAGRILPTITSSHLVTIALDGERHTALVREKQRHPVQGSLLHVDFMVVSMTEKLRASVMIELVGEAPGAKEFNGVLVVGQEQLEVESLPGDLPERITVDLSVLAQIGDAIHVRDIAIPSGVEVLTDPDEMVAILTAPAAEELVEKVEEEGEEAEPEVIERGKKEEEDY